MKKILFALLLSIIGWNIAQAENLNFRTNLLFDYPYKVGEQEAKFMIYTSNKTEKLLYSLNPLELPSYDTNYDRELQVWENLDSETRNKLNFYLKQTWEEKDFSIQMLNYMNTQILLWNVFHPELTLEITEDEERDAQKAKLESAYLEIPQWIKDTEITDSWIIENDENYKVTSEDCKVQVIENQVVVNECKKTSKVTITEKEEDFTLFSSPTSKVIEGYGARSWTITLEQIPIEIEEQTPIENPKEEPIPRDPLEKEEEETDEEKEETDEEEKEELDSKEELEKPIEDTSQIASPTNPPTPNENNNTKEEATMAIQTENSKWLLEQVPNTKEDWIIPIGWIGIALLLYKKCK